MYTNILLASDGSECALRAATAAGTLAGKFNSRLTLVNAFQPIPTVGPYGEILYTGQDDNYTLEMKDYALSRARQILDEMKVPYRSRQEIGDPAIEIVRVAEAEGCDLIVVGSRGQGALKSLFLGSVSDHIVHHAHCPVLIIR
jgi:nucleotide-binding universal stress UspA family protein